MLSWFGFVANEEQSDTALLGIRLMFCVVPGALALANGFILLFYPLNTAVTEQMHRELAVSRESGS